MIRTVLLILLFLISTVPSVYSETPEAREGEILEIEGSETASDSLTKNPEYVPYRHIALRPVMPDTADLRLYKKKSFWRASAETVGFNLGLWAYDRYIENGEYARISWNSIKENFRHGFEWDDDHLSTNMFLHPYNGSLFYNAGRSNGYNFWQSELFALGGSAMWEMFMECEYPSTNDIIATPVGGAAIGEVLYRTSDLIIDDRSTGFERVGREIAAFIVDPMREFTRIVTGRAWKKRNTTGRHFGIPPVSVDLSLGTRILTLMGNDDATKAGVAAEINIEYGARFAESTKAPYDYFSFLIELQGIKTQPILSRIEIMGRLLSKEVFDKKNMHVNVGMYQHFDYFDSDTIRQERPAYLFPCSVPYKFGTPASLGFGVMAKYVPIKTMSLDAYLHLNGVALAGVLTDFYRDYHRNYNWGSGFSIKAAVNWALANDIVSIKLANQYYRIYTWSGYDSEYNWSLTPEGSPVDVQGDASNSAFNHFEASINYRVWKQLYLSCGIDLYTRVTHYKDMKITVDNWTTATPIISSKQLGIHFMLTYKL